MGFAVNNSGLDYLSQHRKTDYTSQTIDDGKSLSREVTFGIHDATSIGDQEGDGGPDPIVQILPSFDEGLFAFDAEGMRCPLSVDSISAVTKIHLREKIVTFNDIFIARFKPPARLIGGPVVNNSHEVMGIAIAATDRGFLMVQPWSRIENCIRMPWE